MAPQSWINTWRLKCELDQYREIKWTRGQEPRKRSLHLLAIFAQLQWHVTVTFEGSLHQDWIARVDKNTRYQHLRRLCLCLDFDRLQLLDDTVTEVIIKRKDDNTPPVYEHDVTSPESVLPLKSTPARDNEYCLVLDQLRFCVREDPYRVRFPVLYCSSHIATKEFSELTRTRQLSASVYEVRAGDSGGRYVCKEVDNPLYEPRDSQVLNQELCNLKMFLGMKGIVQLVAAVVSRNPYQSCSKTLEAYDTYDSDQSNQSNETSQSYQNTRTTPLPVLRGILLEYHPNGTLADALQSAREIPQLVGILRRWALQITEALALIHKQEVTHMDLKPSNILISAENNAVLSDVSGIGGVTRDYLSPEMLGIPDPIVETLESRVYNDIWALGKIFIEMGDASSDDTEKEQLKSIGRDATVDDPTSRPSIHYISSYFSTN